MFKSLWVKFLLLFFSVSLVSLSAAFILRELIVNDFQEYLEGEKEDKVYQVMAAVEGSFEKNAGWNRRDLTESVIWALLFDFEIRILDPANQEIMNTDIAVKSLSPLLKRRILALSALTEDQVLSGSEGFTIYPLYLGGENIGYLATRPLHTRDEQRKEAIFMKRSNRFLLLSLFILGGLSVLLSLMFSRMLTNPIKRLTDAARDIGEGHIRQRVFVSGRDEMGKLAETFNRMAENLDIQQKLRRRLTANVAHELRTPLASIQGELEGMIDGLISVDRERLHSLHEETGRLKKIIEGIEALTSAEASVLNLKKEHIPVKTFLEHILVRFQKLFSDRKVSLELFCGEDVTVSASPDQLSQIVINLLTNALKATEEGGSVRVSGGMDGHGSFIEVADTGRGIQKEDLPFVFERFYKGAEGGLGLGLTIARELTEAHGGRIEVTSQHGQGTTFTVYFPLER